jgi:hypothetical protein
MEVIMEFISQKIFTLSRGCVYCDCVYIHDYVTVQVIQPVTPSKDFGSICVNGNCQCMFADV